jgi:DNA-binding NarL/FixJ family response regulator
MGAVRIALAEDSVLLREGLRRLLVDCGFEVAAAVGDGAALLAAVESTRPDLCVVDIRMPPTYLDEGIRAAQEIRRRWPGTGVVVLSAYVEEGYAAELLGDRPAGVGYLLKDRVEDMEEFAASLRRVAGGGTALDAELLGQLIARSRRSEPLATLTRREREVLAAMAEGRSNVGIGEHLVVGIPAVEKHIANIFMKLGFERSPAEHRRVLAVLQYLGAESRW